MTTLLENSKNITNTDVAALSEEETKQYLTPFAFKMDKSLFGLPLASPSRRGIALLIDLALIALLSDISGVVLALAIAITLYRLGNIKRAQDRGKLVGYKRRAVMRFIAAFMVFVVLIDTIPPLLQYLGIEETGIEETGIEETGIEDTGIEIRVADTPLSLTESVALTSAAFTVIKTIAESDCQEFNCRQTELDSVAIQMANISYESDIKVTKAQLNDIFTDISKKIELSPNEQQQLFVSMQYKYDEELSRLAGDESLALNESTVEASEEENTQTKEAIFVLGEGGQLSDVETQEEESSSNKPVYSIVEWVKGIIEDLGLGFGWATFYFTAFIALGKGQTLGKMLLGIKVLQLDGTPLSLWDSFGRYGGYGAGLATGLLGFIQIYWDPNKQAIHDKISATVVIDLRKARLSQNK